MILSTLLLTLFSLPSTLATPRPEALAARDLSIRRFEERYLNTLSYALPNNTIKLIGYKKIIMTPSELFDLEHAIATQPSEWESLSSAYYDPIDRAMRVYFPVERALVRHRGKLVEASDMGELPHSNIEGDCAVVGRYQTASVRGLPKANRIEDGIIYLREESPIVRRHTSGGNVHVYDFGWRRGMHDHGHGDKSKRGEREGGSCFQNHGNKVCSIEYGIDEGRCTRPKGTIKECIDYNGWPFKNCNNHSDKKAFPGSDCFVAVARGHCWNEVEDALFGHD